MIQQGPKPQIKITTEMMKNFKTIACDCGGILFESGLIFKKISALLSPSGKEEIYPHEVLIYKTCGKVPAELDMSGFLPEEVKAKSLYGVIGAVGITPLSFK